MPANIKIPFGKYQGKDLDDVPADYLIWCLEQSWFEAKYPELNDYLNSIYNTLLAESEEKINSRERENDKPTY